MAQFDRVVIVGVGLLGGSIGLALRERNLARRVIGFGPREQSLQAAIIAGAVDQVELDLATACRGADVVVICTPVKWVAYYARQCAPHLNPNGWITDVGSTKARIVEELSQDADTFCGSHPLAGSDKSGVEHASPSLFDGRLTVITPSDATRELRIGQVEDFWHMLGAQTVRLSASEHDRAIASTSHLPHIVAAALAAATPTKLLPLVASGWCDTTRIAGGSAELWLQILDENREPVLHALRHYGRALDDWIEALQNGDQAHLEELLQTGKKIRDSVGN